MLRSDGLLGEIKKALTEYVLNAEMDAYWAVESKQAVGIHRNGNSKKMVLTDEGAFELAIPRDQHARFNPVLIARYRRRFLGFDDKVAALYACVIGTHAIQAHIRKLPGDFAGAGFGGH